MVGWEGRASLVLLCAEWSLGKEIFALGLPPAWGSTHSAE